MERRQSDRRQDGNKIEGTIRLIREQTRSQLLVRLGRTMMYSITLLVLSISIVFVYLSIRHGEVVGEQMVLRAMDAVFHTLRIAIGID